MRYRLRTLLIVVALGPPVLGLVCPRLLCHYSAWRRDCAERAERAELDAIMSQLLRDTSKRPNRGSSLKDLYGEQPPATEGPEMFAVPIPDYIPDYRPPTLNDA